MILMITFKLGKSSIFHCTSSTIVLVSTDVMFHCTRPPELSSNILEFGSFGVLRQTCIPTLPAEIRLVTEEELLNREDMHYYHVLKSIHADMGYSKLNWGNKQEALYQNRSILLEAKKKIKPYGLK